MKKLLGNNIWTSFSRRYLIFGIVLHWRGDQLKAYQNICLSKDVSMIIEVVVWHYEDFKLLFWTYKSFDLNILSLLFCTKASNNFSGAWPWSSISFLWPWNKETQFELLLTTSEQFLYPLKISLTHFDFFFVKARSTMN